MKGRFFRRGFAAERTLPVLLVVSAEFSPSLFRSRIFYCVHFGVTLPVLKGGGQNPLEGMRKVLKEGVAA